MSHVATKIELILSCEGLADKDTTSKSDPFIIAMIEVADKPALKYSPLGKTEVIMNNLNPKFTTTIKMDYYFETKQKLRFDIYDCDDVKNTNDLSKHESLGYVLVDLPYVMGQRGHAKVPIQDGKGTLTVGVMELGNDVNEMIEVQIRGVNLAKMDTFGQSDPYVKVFRRIRTGEEVLLYTTEIIKVTLNPLFKKFTMPVGKLCGGNKDSPCLRLECWDYDYFKDDPMGEVLVSVNQIAKGQSSTLKIPNKNKTFGDISFSGSHLYRIPSFCDFLKGGLQLSLAVSIDYTASNLDARNPRSLHFINPAAPNHYSHAIMAVGDVLVGYVSDKQFACFGFGAVLPGQSTASHFFNLTMNTNPFVRSVQEILNVYATSLTTVALSGPTNFAPTITEATRLARSRPNNYMILMIITDGEITDVLDTIDALVAADDAPLSIVIVGVGSDCDFQQMSVLDGDSNVLHASDGRVSRRDLVQFVPMKNFANVPPPGLANEVLYEIPAQVLKWANLVGYKAPAAAAENVI
jgi:hypothetical protein